MTYFLAKTDPDCYSIDDFVKEQETVWDGIRNPAAVLAIKSWKIGDRVLIYHSQGQACIVGLAEVTGAPHPDPKNEKSWVGTLKLIRTYPEPQRVTLREIKATGLFTDFALVKQSRLSTMLCPPEFIDWLRARGLDVS